MQSVIAAIVTLVIVAPLTWVFATLYHKKVSAAKIGNAEDKAREIIDEALKTAETKKRESLLEVKEESIRTKNELDKEIKRDVQKRRDMSAGFSKRKRTSIRNQMQSRKRKQVWLPEKKNWQSSAKKFPSLTSRDYRNSNESQV